MIWIAAYLGSVLGAFLTIVAMTVMRNEERHSLGRIGWLALVLLSPPVGLILFLWLGGKKISAEHDRRDLVDIPQEEGDCEGARDEYVHLLTSRSLPRPTDKNRFTLLDSTESRYLAFLDLIENARESLYVMTFIMDAERTASEIVARLCEKAKAGVEVRLLCDGFGSFQLPEDKLQEVRDAGGSAGRFKPMSMVSKLAYLNFRNHRKLAIADGARAILGGANLVEDEVSAESSASSWIDLSALIEGPAATQLEAVFRSDWQFAMDERLSLKNRSSRRQPIKQEEDSRISVMPIGPDGPTEILGDFWQLGIHRANERIWLCTPYFVPPPLAMGALESACRRGLDVRIVVPQTSDLPPVDHARYDYFEDLIDVGAKVLRLPDKMMHAKVGVIDEQVALVGSANFDIRSFFLNYELSVVVHDRQTIQRISHSYESIADTCATGLEERSRLRSALSTMARLFASEL